MPRIKLNIILILMVCPLTSIVDLHVLGFNRITVSGSACVWDRIKYVIDCLPLALDKLASLLSPLLHAHLPLMRSFRLELKDKPYH
jgi:hypothetical protein